MTDPAGEIEWKTLTDTWVHDCDPPTTPAYHTAATPDGSAPTLPVGRVWFCGCGQPWGSTGTAWVAVDRAEVRPGPRLVRAVGDLRTSHEGSPSAQPGQSPADATT